MSLGDLATAHLNARLAREQAEQRLPSITAALLRDGDVIWESAAGHVDGRADGEPATPDTQYRVGSITKTMVAVGILRLVADHSIDLADPIRAHLPDLDASLDGVSVTALLTQTAGLYAETDGPWWERSPGVGWEQLLPSIRLAHNPGRRFHYTNVGFAVLGRLLEQKRQRPWFDVLTDEVFAPLAMRRTSYAAVAPSAPGLAVHASSDLLHSEPAQDTGAMAPAGQIWSTVGDLCRLGAFLQAGNPVVLPDHLRRAMQVPAAVVDTPGQPWTRAYGFGLDVYNDSGTRLIGHGGSMPGFQARLAVDIDTGDGVALLTNGTSGPSSGVPSALLRLLGEYAPQQPSPWHADSSASSSVDLTGAWHWGPRRFELTSAPDGGLSLHFSDGSLWSRFVLNDDKTWTGQDDYWAGETLRVQDRGGRTPYLDLGSFRLTREPYDPDADIPGGVDPAGWHA